jgi:urease accessory protein
VTAAATRTHTFADNRVRARVALRVEAADARSRVVRVHEEGALRVRFPNAAGAALEAVTINSAGGIAEGDRFDFDLAVGPSANAIVTTAAAEKVYRSRGEEARLGVRLAVEAGGSLAWLPQETILFDGARIARTIDVDLAADARLVLAEAVVFGRAAMGEAVASGRLIDRWRVRRAGTLVFADTLRLDGAIADKLGASAVAAGGRAVATLLVVPGAEADAGAARAALPRLAGEAGVSAWNGLCLARLVAADGATLRADMAMLFSALRVPLPRLRLA